MQNSEGYLFISPDMIQFVARMHVLQAAAEGFISEEERMSIEMVRRLMAAAFSKSDFFRVVYSPALEMSPIPYSKVVASRTMPAGCPSRPCPSLT